MWQLLTILPFEWAIALVQRQKSFGSYSVLVKLLQVKFEHFSKGCSSHYFPLEAVYFEWEAFQAVLVLHFYSRPWPSCYERPLINYLLLEIVFILMNFIRYEYRTNVVWNSAWINFISTSANNRTKIIIFKWLHDLCT